MSLRSERGSALPAVIGVMLTIGILVAVVASTSIHVRESTTADRAARRAFQAAEAALHVAAYRLRKVMPAPGECLGLTPQAPSGGTCPLTPAQNAGNGATYRYSVTDVLSAGSTQCALPAGTDYANYDHRCITGVGTVGGTTRRVQAILSSARASGKFPLNGVLALSGVTQSGTSTINGEFGSNGLMKFSGSTLPTAPVKLGPGGSVNPGSVPTEPHAAFTAPRDAAAFVWTGGVAGDPSKPPHNDNSRFFPLPANVSFSAGRVLSASNTVGSAASPWILPGGTYNVCDISFGNKTWIQVAAGAQVHIYVDSPNRPGSGCPAGTGGFTATNTFNFLNPSMDPAALQIEFYGGPGSDFKVSNQATLYALIYAPNTQFTSTGSGAFVGGIVAESVTTSNTFNMTGAVPAAFLNGSDDYEAQGWIECSPNAPAGGAPGANC